jgi:hypothetical protein
MNTGIAVWASIALNAEYFTCLLSTRLNVYSFTRVWMCRALTTYVCVCDCVMCVHDACMHPYISSWTEHSLYHILKRAKICTTAPDLFWHWWQSYSAVLVVGGFVMDMTEAQILPIEGSGIAKVCLQTILSLSHSLSLPASLSLKVRACLSLSLSDSLSVCRFGNSLSLSLFLFLVVSALSRWDVASWCFLLSRLTWTATWWSRPCLLLISCSMSFHTGVVSVSRSLLHMLTHKAGHGL